MANMIKWKDEYELGVEAIDEQHKKLFEIANRAYDLLMNEFILDKYDKIIQILEELKDYTVFHFESEEKYMLSINYRKFLSHKVKHDTLIQEITDLDLSEIDLNQDESVDKILKFIVNWIDNHILNDDKLIVGI